MYAFVVGRPARGPLRFCVSAADAYQFHRAHVKNDLEPYICLFEECEGPQELYNHREEWLKHMREHTLRWRCKSKSHSIVFPSQDLYQRHLEKVHNPAFTDMQLDSLSERNVGVIGPMFELCPLCGFEETQGGLEDHIVDHLRFLALKSLPPYYGEDGEGSGSERGSLSTSKPPSRSTIKGDLEMHLKPIFNDVSEQLNS